MGKRKTAKMKKKRTMSETERFIREYKKKEAKCPVCKTRKRAHKKLMKTRGKRSIVKAIRYYWNKYLECESCIEKA